MATPIEHTPVERAVRAVRAAMALLGCLALALSVARPSGAQPVTPPATVIVSRDGPVRTLAEGVRRAPAGGRVVVRPGTYREPTVVVRRPLTIVGEGWPTLDGERQRELLRIEADDVTVRGLRFAHVGRSMTEDRAAVRVVLRRGCAIVGNRFDDTFFGVYLQKAADCRVTDNAFAGTAGAGDESTSGNAIHLWSARDVLIARNRIRGHRDGIYFEFVRHARVEDNESADNVRYGLHFMYSDSCAYARNTFRRNGSGVAVMYTNTVAMTGNRFLDNRGGAAYGLLLKEIGDPVLTGNEFARNTVGLMADGVTRLVAEHNVFADNGWAVRLMANGQDGRFVANDFAGNSFDVATNGGTGGAATFDGNWFDDYRGYDLDGDGRGDVPHRPVRLFSLLVARYEVALVLQRSVFVGLLDGAERAIPSLTPRRLADPRPAMRPVARPRPFPPSPPSPTARSGA
ncbi:MAG TPA: nitrous oxide reductase family maturation protein NosD [Gemmatimonadaceae bacterium]|nr:nitrous oxide reductase family maturation protein NosD [Gemmatimonadaceae bacterium]